MGRTAGAIRASIFWTHCHHTLNNSITLYVPISSLTTFDSLSYDYLDPVHAHDLTTITASGLFLAMAAIQQKVQDVVKHYRPARVNPYASYLSMFQLHADKT